MKNNKKVKGKSKEKNIRPIIPFLRRTHTRTHRNPLGMQTLPTLGFVSQERTTDTYDSEGGHVPYHGGFPLERRLVVQGVERVGGRARHVLERRAAAARIAAVVGDLVGAPLVEVEAAACGKVRVRAGGGGEGGG